ncbi:hypothetical protein AXF42_Ash001823 [Apostasia shenzhenica]|uniref:Uncharacterized protein n=1 Tax=Apostasia shenzhenica TaxID=1088818 RepID=A0A2I0ABC2_9ASPA|nr:hypothetical protein AXF42_Ash001823 [Apostasia shenzhenica]
MAAKWAQKTIVLPPQKRGCHLVTSKILKEIEQELSGFKCGLAHFFLQHTSASLTINENHDSDVQDDTETFLSRIVPEGRSAPWKHTLEGPDDMPAHIKSSMFGCALTYAPFDLSSKDFCRFFFIICLTSLSTSGFLLLMVTSIWELGRVYGYVSTEIMLPRAK